MFVLHCTYLGLPYHSFWIISYVCQKHPPYIQNLIWQLPCHYHVPTATYISEKMCLHNHKWCGLGFYSSCCILFLTLKKSQVTKSTSTWNLPGVHVDPLQPVGECHIQGEAEGAGWDHKPHQGETLWCYWWHIQGSSALEGLHEGFWRMGECWF